MHGELHASEERLVYLATVVACLGCYLALEVTTGACGAHAGEPHMGRLKAGLSVHACLSTQL